MDIGPRNATSAGPVSHFCAGGCFGVLPGTFGFRAGRGQNLVFDWPVDSVALVEALSQKWLFAGSQVAGSSVAAPELLASQRKMAIAERFSYQRLKFGRSPLFQQN